jgi:hypothetical protein
MKTVIDAVNEFKGEYFDGECGREDYQNEVIMAKRDFAGYRFGDLGIGSGNTKQNEYWLLICTRAQFIATVAECETSFGKVTHGEYYDYVNASKLLLTKDLDKEIDMGIDWSKTKYNFALVNSSADMVEFSEFKPVLTDDTECYMIKESVVLYYAGPWVIAERHASKPTPIFTQEMADNGVLPGVGVECMVRRTKDHDYVTCKRYCTIEGIHFVKILDADFIGDVAKSIGLPTRDFAFICLDGSADFKPLTPTITLIDGECYQFDYHKGTFRGYFKLSHGRLYHSTGYYHESVCTNIQPLTVEK